MSKRSNLSEGVLYTPAQGMTLWGELLRWAWGPSPGESASVWVTEAPSPMGAPCSLKSLSAVQRYTDSLALAWTAEKEAWEKHQVNHMSEKSAAWG